MTQDETIELARKSGFVEYELDDGTTNAFDKRYEAFAKLVALRYEKKISDLENIICQRHWDVLQEREACASMLEDWDKHAWNPFDCAQAIRARGQA